MQFNDAEFQSQLASRMNFFDSGDVELLETFLQLIVAGDVEMSSHVRKEMNKGTGDVADWIVMALLSTDS